ncbi:MAG: hypothetical protein E7813_24720 [Bradyrhizobium sp.]|uniref:hypothetical protein n=1 Tax=Bradyrhizobium sp. TaxID=376 RepID=UPI00120A8D5E|nr:hypothetical protein [Bradyrhizobium sp.]THD59455.1 MAG: hypothetical protein E7813_24720 [Bradyrhizobium sp.]
MKIALYGLLAILLPITSANCGDHSQPGADQEHLSKDKCTADKQCLSRCFGELQKDADEGGFIYQSIMCNARCNTGPAECVPELPMRWTFRNRTGVPITGGVYDDDDSTGIHGEPVLIPDNTEDTMDIVCMRGKKACYGFENSEQVRHWGIGRKDLGSQYNCTNCCWQCGEAPVVDLTF